MSTTEAPAEDLHKCVERLQAEKLALEKDLKKKNDLIALTKDKQSVQQIVDENAKMKQEMEVLEMFKTQNVALKDHMHQIAASSDQQRVKLAQLTKENLELRSKLPDHDPAVAVAAENPMDPIIKGFESTIADLRAENIKLEESLKKCQDELADEKKKVAELTTKSSSTNTTAAATTVTAASATVITSKLWWGSKPTTPTPSAGAGATTAAHPAVTSTTAPASTSTTHLLSATDTTKLEDQLKLATSEIEKLKTQISTLQSTGKHASATNDFDLVKASVLEETKKEHLKAIESLETEIQTLKTQLQHSKVSYTENQTLLGSIEKSLHETKEALEKAKEESKSFKQKWEESESKATALKEFEGEVSKLSSELKSLAQSLDASKAETIQATTKIAQDAQTTATLATKATDLEKSLTSAQSQITTLTSTLKDQTDKFQSLLTESNANKITHEKTLQALSTEKESLVFKYEASIRGLQETIAKKNLEVQMLQAKSASAEAAAIQSTEPNPDGTVSLAPAQPPPVFDLFASPEFEILKNGYENDKKISEERINTLEGKIQSQLSEIEALGKAVAEKDKEIEALKQKSVELNQHFWTRLQTKEAELAGLITARDQLQQQVDQVSSQLADSNKNSSGLEGKLQETILALKKEHTESLKKQALESEASHKNLLDQAISDAKKEKLELEAKYTKDRSTIEEKYKIEKSALEEASAKAAKELNQLRKEISEIKDTASKGSKNSEAHFKTLEEKTKKELLALEEKHIKELTELSETSKRTLIDLEARLKKEAAASEEKAVKAAEERKKKEIEEKLTKEKRDVEEKLHKEKSALDEKHQKEKTEAEEKFKKEKTKIQSDLDTAKAEVDKLKKDVANNEAQKTEQAKKFEKELFSRNDDIGKYTTRIKAVESELETFKTDSAKTAADLNEKLSTANTTINKLNTDIASEKEKYTQLQNDLKNTQDKVTAIQAKLDMVTAELEVSRSSSDRLSKMNGEKDDSIKKLKQRTEELTQTQATLAKTVAGLEKDKENLNQTISSQTKKIAALETNLQQQQTEFAEARKVDTKNLEALNETIVSLKTENFNMATKVKDVQSEHRAMEKRGALIIKDLQKQIIKERKRQANSPEQSQNDSMDSLATTSHSRQASEGLVRKPTKSYSHNEAASSSGVGIPKVERLTTELLQLAKENETLNKRSKNAEEDIRALQDRLAKQTEELELKSKAVQQYMLREYSTQLQPEESKKTGFSMDMLTNSSAMHKMNPVLLSQVNIKMQKLLEELTSKMMGLEEENRVLKRADQTATNTVLKSSTV
ncbi:UNVERIFIED_CONTAM: hypothetical protein HDU68_004589 [Siphonaria sp. JEL0065]|nr:hypothetical protein HDU68_004589 [Siphonaria sp. JEL0065]